MDLSTSTLARRSLSASSSSSPSLPRHRSVACSSSAVPCRRLRPLPPVAAAASRHALAAAVIGRQRAAVAARASAVPPSSPSNSSSSSDQPSSKATSEPASSAATLPSSSSSSSSSSAAEPLLTPATAAGVSTSAAEAAARVLFDPEALAAASAAALEKSRSRVARLELLVDLRRLYRNLLRADRLLEAPSPAYCPPESISSSSNDNNNDNSDSDGRSTSGSSSSSISNSSSSTNDTDSAAAEVAAAAAVQYVAELQLTEVQLRAALRALSGTYGDRVSDAFVSPHLKMAAVTAEKKSEAAPAATATPAAATEASPSPSTSSSSSSDASETEGSADTAAGTTAAATAPVPAPAPSAPALLSPEAARDALYSRVAAVSEALGSRWRAELPLLPFPSPAAAQAALDTRNRRYVGSPLSGVSSSSKGEKNTGSVLARGATSLAGGHKVSVSAAVGGVAALCSGACAIFSSPGATSSRMTR